MQVHRPNAPSDTLDRAHELARPDVVRLQTPTRIANPPYLVSLTHRQRRDPVLLERRIQLRPLADGRVVTPQLPVASPHDELRPGVFVVTALIKSDRAIPRLVAETNLIRLAALCTVRQHARHPPPIVSLLLLLVLNDVNLYRVHLELRPPASNSEPLRGRMVRRTGHVRRTRERPQHVLQPLVVHHHPPALLHPAHHQPTVQNDPVN